jgi:anaerobic selenocysteine-containing dehydrogenase
MKLNYEAAMRYIIVLDYIDHHFDHHDREYMKRRCETFDAIAASKGEDKDLREYVSSDASDASEVLLEIAKMAKMAKQA